jgi:hypothetical protein
MKTKFKLQGLLFIALLYMSLICLNWYTNLNEVRLYEEKDKRELTQLEINKYIVKPDNKKKYYYVKQYEYVGKNSLIPFIVNKKLLKEHRAKIVQQDCGC